VAQGIAGFARDRAHIEFNETYRLGEADLGFGELLPPKPGWLEQEEYEERNAGFHARTIGEALRCTQPAENVRRRGTERHD
jgi:hypothetical protein